MPTNLASLESALADRRARYGSFEDVALTATVIRLALEKPQKKMSAVQGEALSMIANKLARIVNGDANYKDTWDDIAGYCLLVANTLQPEAE